MYKLHRHQGHSTMNKKPSDDFLERLKLKDGQLHLYKMSYWYPLRPQARYTIDGRQYPLSAGDSVHFDAGKAHRLANVGSEVAEMLAITTLSLFDDHSTP